MTADSLVSQQTRSLRTLRMCRRVAKRCQLVGPVMTPELEVAVANAQADRAARICNAQAITDSLVVTTRTRVRFSRMQRLNARASSPVRSPVETSGTSSFWGRKTPDARFYRTHYRRGLAKGAVRPARTVTNAQAQRADAFNFALEPVPFTKEEARKHRVFASTCLLYTSDAADEP